MPSLNLDQIRELIPHRPPFLWLDEIVDYSATAIHARKLLSPHLDVFRGHYPQFPVFPGVLLCEAAMQAGSVLISKLPNGALKPGKIPVVARLNTVKFKQLVRPGDLLDIHSEMTDIVAGTFFLKARILVGAKLVVTLDFACGSTDAL